MNGLPGLDEIRSVSRTAVSAVTVVFKDGTDVWFARQMVSERLKLAEADIPPGYGRPELAPVSTGLGEIYEFYLDVEDATRRWSCARCSTGWSRSSCAPCPASSRSTAWAARPSSTRSSLDPKRLAAYQLSLARHPRASSSGTTRNVGGGYIEKNREPFVIRGDAQFQDARGHRRTPSSPSTPTARRC